MPSAVNHDCSGSPTRLTIPAYGVVVSYQIAALPVLQRHHLLQRPAGLGAGTEQAARDVVDQGHRALGVGDDDAVGQRVEDLSPSTPSD